jgi:predicted ATPase
MPLTSIRLLNFKSFEDSGEIKLAPLTVLFGRNNTGKSSIIQSLLLLCQTLDAPADVARLNLRGPVYAAGTYADLVHKHQLKQNMTLELGVSVRGTSRSGHLELQFKSDEPQAPRLARLTVNSPNAEPLAVSRGRGAGGPYEMMIGQDNLGGEKKANFRFSVNQFLPLIGEEPSHVGRPSTRREQCRTAARQILREVDESLRSTRAIGAFRRQPDRRYEYQGRPPEGVDVTGLHVIDALLEDANRRRKRGELIRGVNRWLEKVGRVRLLPIRGISRHAKIYEIRLKDTDSGRWANFADVGFGIAQALPVIVEGLRTPEGGMFLVQEPEIHLHPDAQLAMADFLIGLVRSNRRVIVETHSENILLRIRHAVVTHTNKASNGRAGLAPDDISIVHVHKTEDGASHADRLDLDELGQIRNWPRGFMEEATEERMRILEDMSRTAKRDRDARAVAPPLVSSSKNARTKSLRGSGTCCRYSASSLRLISETTAAGRANAGTTPATAGSPGRTTMCCERQSAMPARPSSPRKIACSPPTPASTAGFACMCRIRRPETHP